MIDKPISVLFSLPNVSRTGGGVSESARLQVAALTQNGDTDISVLSFDDVYFAEDRENWTAGDVRAFRTYGPKSFGFSPGLLWALLRERPDVVHVHGVWQFHCAVVYLWSILTGRPYVVTPHGMLEPWIRARSRRLKWLVSKLYQDRFLKRAAAFHILTEKERQDVAEYLCGQPTIVIPNYAPPFRNAPVLPGWWKPEFEGRDIFLFMGRIHEKKGCIELCEAWDRVCSENKDFANRSALVFCGWNDGLVGFEEKVLALDNVHENAVFAGPQYGDDKRRSLSVASFFILPSKSEGLPMAILEAWSAGIPAIMTRECNLPEGFAREAAIPTGSDVGSVALSLNSASKMSEDLRSQTARNAKALLQERFSPESVRVALLNMYRSAVNGGSK